MKHTILTAHAFANAPAAAPTPDTAKLKSAPVVTAISAAVPMPEQKSARRGTASVFPFDQLEVNQSFGVKDRDKASLSSVVSAQNRKHVTETPGAPVDLKDVNGAVVGQTPGDTVKTVTKHFFAVDVDAKKDPDGASVRIFRDK
jgi:hypothetical protein